jgi:hypothetical protein
MPVGPILRIEEAIAGCRRNLLGGSARAEIAQNICLCLWRAWTEADRDGQSDRESWTTALQIQNDRNDIFAASIGARHCDASIGDRRADRGHLGAD